MLRSVNSISSLNALFSKNKKMPLLIHSGSANRLLGMAVKSSFRNKKLILLFHMMEGEMVASVASIEGRACMLDGGP